MAVQRITIRLAILFLILGSTTAWSQRLKSEAKSDVPAVAESKIKPRYSDAHKAYILEEDDYSAPHGHHGGGKAEDYVESEDQKNVQEDGETQGAEHADKNIKDDEYDDHSSKAEHKTFEAGGLTYNKHLKDHKADNKELENVKEHDIGEKFGGEAVKEHKLGKHKEKSKGHKVNGFKNTYHKEEYGDHKTFHDEFLDTDHQHNYDDHHEHKELHGGKFSKGFKHDGKSKKFDKGDEKHEFGKAGYDSYNEGKHEKGGQLSKHRHGSKKHQAHYDSNYKRNKNSVHKVKKGNPPPPMPYVDVDIPHVPHHGPHQAQIEPYAPHHNHHHQQDVHVPSPHYTSHGHDLSHHAPNDDLHGSHHAHEGQLDTHGGYTHGSHHDLDNHKEYASEEDDHGSDYQERIPKTQHRIPQKVQSEDKSEEKNIETLEPPTRKLEPLSHKQPVIPNYGIQQYRQPVYQEQPRFQRPEYIRQEKLSHPFEDRVHDHKHRFRYGFQPRNHHHRSHHHFNHQPRYHHHHLNHHNQQQQQQQLQPFPRFPGFGHHHHTHGHHHHDAHKKHFRHTPVHHEPIYKPVSQARQPEHQPGQSFKPVTQVHQPEHHLGQSFKPATHVHQSEHQLAKSDRSEGQPQYSQRYE